MARFDHPSPAPLDTLETHFPGLLDSAYAPVVIPSVNGETIATLHARIAYALSAIIAAADADAAAPTALLVCTHAAAMIAIGRVLTGAMPADEAADDFRCFTCALSRFERRGGAAVAAAPPPWSARHPDDIPEVQWKGSGVAGGWECVLNGDCSFLSGGEERGW